MFFLRGDTVKVVEVNDLKKSYGNFKALKGITFEIQKGEIFGLIGPNGAGKTTTLRVICTLLKPDAGTVKVFGYDLLKEPQEIRKVISYDLSSLSVPLKVVIFAIPFTHPMLSIRNLLFGKELFVVYGCIYNVALAVILIILITKIFNSDRLITGVSFKSLKENSFLKNSKLQNPAK